MANPTNGGSRPVPDPTALTDAAIAKLKESMTEYIDGQFAMLDERMKGRDSTLRAEASGQTALDEERWETLRRNNERESRDNKDRVDAAFAAQKEAAAAQDAANAKAIDKSERATAETIKTNQELNQTKTDALAKTLDGLTLTVAGITVAKQTATDTATTNRAERTDQRGGNAAIYAAVGLGITILLALLTIIGFIFARMP